MRELKFRFYSNHLKKFVVPGDSIFVGALKDPSMNPMQLTGLTDRNGVDIYEGDIIAAKLNGGYVERVYWHGPPDIVGVVYWDLTGFRLKANGEKDFRYSDFTDFAELDDWEPLVMMNESQSEVIGNIYENPELITNGTIKTGE